MNNSQQLNTIRLIVILSITLVFGVVLHRRVFNDRPALAENLKTARAEVYAPPSSDGQTPPENAKINDAANNAENQVKKQNDQVQEGDAPLSDDRQPTTPNPQIDSGFVKNLSARSAIVTDKDANLIIYQKNINEKVPMASLTKLMTAIVASDNLDPKTRIKITKTAVGEEGVAGNLKPGEEFALSDLMKIMLIASSNDAAFAIKEYFADFNIDLIALMNQKAENLGMTDTRFANATGLDQENHFSTAYDLAKLASYVFNKKNDILDIIERKQAVVQSLNQKTEHLLLTTNQLLRDNDPEMLGGKTGYTKNASGCMLSVLKDGRMIVVLGSEDRFGDTKELIRNAKVKNP